MKFQIPAQVLKIHFLGVSLSQPQLPTVPVPPASLAAVTAAGRVNIGGLQQPLVTVTSASDLRSHLILTAQYFLSESDIYYHPANQKPFFHPLTNEKAQVTITKIIFI